MTFDTAEIFSAFETDPGRTLAFLKWLADTCELRGRLRVLDVGCGTGRLLPGFHDLGWSATGFEPSGVFRAAARDVAEKVGIVVLAGGFNEITAENEYELVVGINSSFAHVLRPEDRLDAFQRCFRALVAGGVLFLDVPNFIWILQHYRQPQEMWVSQAGARIRLIRQHEIDARAATFTTLEDYTVYPSDQAQAESTVRLTHAYAITTYPELAFGLERVGFLSPSTVTSYEARTFDDVSEARLMIVAQKPREVADGESESGSG